MPEKVTLLKRFTVYSLIAFVFTGTLLVISISNHFKKDMINELQNVTQLTLDTLLKPELSPNEFNTPLPKYKIDRLNQKLKRTMILTNITGIKIINSKGFIIYSNDPEAVGKFEVLDSGLEKALSNKLQYEIRGQVKGLGTANEKFIEINSPISYDKSVLGVFKVFIPYDAVGKHLYLINRTIILVMFSGLSFLYALLLKIIYDTSNTLIIQNKSLLKKQVELKKSYLKLNDTYKDTVLALSNAIDARDPYTAGHSGRVTNIAMAIGKQLDLPEEILDTLELSALLHDIGKLGIPDNILLKPDKLSENEFLKIKEHPVIGVEILESVDFLNKTLPGILYHHEKYAGGGYPKGLEGEGIPLESRIISVADAFDAMTSDRPYRKSLSHDKAITEIIKFKDIQFDPMVVDAFLKVIA